MTEDIIPQEVDMASRWISNLESLDYMKAQLDQAHSTLEQATTPQDKRAAHNLINLAQYRLRDVENTHRQVFMEHADRVTIGPPQPTPWKSAEQIQADGIIGLYKMGAGNG